MKKNGKKGAAVVNTELNKTEFFEALEALEKERGIPMEYMLEKVEAALMASCRKELGNVNVRVDISREKKDMRIFKCLTVVEEVTDPKTEISLEDAQNISRRYEPGSVIEEELKTRTFGRISAQTAKQVIVQAIREAEKNNITREYDRKKEEVISALVQKRDDVTGDVWVDTGTSSDVLLPKADQIPGETLSVGDRVRVFVTEVNHSDDDRAPAVTLSRTAPAMIKRMFETDIPEIADGTVLVKGIAREAGSRTKIAVRHKARECCGIRPYRWRGDEPRLAVKHHVAHSWELLLRDNWKREPSCLENGKRETFKRGWEGDKRGSRVLCCHVARKARKLDAAIDAKTACEPAAIVRDRRIGAAKETHSPFGEVRGDCREGADQEQLVLDAVDHRGGTQHKFFLTPRNGLDFGVVADCHDGGMWRKVFELAFVVATKNLHRVELVECLPYRAVAERMFPLEKAVWRKMKLEDYGRAPGPFKVSSPVKIYGLVRPCGDKGVPFLPERRGKSAALHKTHLVPTRRHRGGEVLHRLVGPPSNGEAVLVDTELHVVFCMSQSLR